VPVVLASPARGEVGRVGEIVVDATTSEILADNEEVFQQGIDTLY
jgi:hypothetical protein